MSPKDDQFFANITLEELIDPVNLNEKKLVRISDGFDFVRQHILLYFHLFFFVLLQFIRSAIRFNNELLLIKVAANRYMRSLFFYPEGSFGYSVSSSANVLLGSSFVLSPSLLISSSFALSIIHFYRSVCMTVCLFVRLSACLYLFPSYVYA